jgi:hypothetical protein
MTHGGGVVWVKPMKSHSSLFNSTSERLVRDTEMAAALNVTSRFVHILRPVASCGPLNWEARSDFLCMKIWRGFSAVKTRSVRNRPRQRRPSKTQWGNRRASRMTTRKAAPGTGRRRASQRIHVLVTPLSESRQASMLISLKRFDD